MPGIRMTCTAPTRPSLAFLPPLPPPQNYSKLSCLARCAGLRGCSSFSLVASRPKEMPFLDARRMRIT